MSEIWNLSEVCRCCHSSGVFKSLLDPFIYDGNQEVYSDLLSDVLGIHIRKPSFAASHTICEQCIIQLRFCRSFKQQVLSCEKKFQEYCKNELFNSGAVKVEGDEEQAKNIKEKMKTVTKAKKINQSKGTKKVINKTNYKENKKAGRASPYSCEFCRRGFDKKSKLLEHELEKHKMEALSCKICELTFKTHEIRTMHMKKHNATGNGLRCKHCDKYYGSEKALVEHINSHYNDDKFPCDICPKKYPYKHTLLRHKEWHKQNFIKSHIRLHECNLCSMAFKSSWELRTHKLRIHKSVFLERQKLKTLKRKLRGPFTCNVCDKLLSTDYCLKRHMAMHTGLKPERRKCDLCDLTFGTTGSMNRHKQNVHGNNKKQMCNICNKLCSNLKEHKNVHIRPYKCERCFKSFPAKNTLNRHINFVHLGVRPFSCESCGLSFRRMDLYRKHLRKAHSEGTVKTESSAENAGRIDNICDGINEVMSRLGSTN